MILSLGTSARDAWEVTFMSVREPDRGRTYPVGDRDACVSKQAGIGRQERDGCGKWKLAGGNRWETSKHMEKTTVHKSTNTPTREENTPVNPYQQQHFVFSRPLFINTNTQT